MGCCPTVAVLLQDQSSIAQLGRNMAIKFAELFQRLDRLELKLNRILEKDDGSHGKLGTVGADSNDGSPEGTNNEVTIEPPPSPLNHQNKSEPTIYIATWRGRIPAFSLKTNQVNRILEIDENIFGITFDSMQRKLYWSSFDKIYRSNSDGTEQETVWNMNHYSTLHGLAIDWITGNLYVTTWGGHVLACGTTGPSSGNLNCFTILDRQRSAAGIALDPTHSLMYWTRSSTGSIHKAGMDGSTPVTLVTGLESPVGITIDFTSQRIYWTEGSSHKIQSSDLGGRDVKLVVQLPTTGSYPWGIAFWNDRIYWGNNENQTLQSCTKDGQDIQTLYIGTKQFRHITIVPVIHEPTNRTNDCQGRNCSTLCVLTQTSYRCLP